MSDIVKALREIADELEKVSQTDLEKIDPSSLRLTLRSYVVALRALASVPDPLLSADPRVRQREMIEAAKGEFHRDDEETRMAVCADGPCQGDTIPLNPAMPVDAFTAVQGHRYQLRTDGQLHFKP